jgi:putative IMPACT (imprinted ancient) family translation regulator
VYFLKKIDIHFQISFDYKNMNRVMRIIKEKNLNIVSQNMNENCQIEISIRKKILLKLNKYKN